MSDDQECGPRRRFRPGYWRRYTTIIGSFAASWLVLLLLDRVVDSESGELVLIFVRLAVTIAFVILFFRFMRRERDALEREQD